MDHMMFYREVSQLVSNKGVGWAEHENSMLTNDILLIKIKFCRLLTLKIIYTKLFRYYSHRIMNYIKINKYMESYIMKNEYKF